MTEKEIAELQHRIAYSARQFERFRLQAIQSQLKAQLALSQNRPEEAQKWIQAGQNQIHWLEEVMDHNDSLSRKLNPGTTD